MINNACCVIFVYFFTVQNHFRFLLFSYNEICFLEIICFYYTFLFCTRIFFPYFCFSDTIYFYVYYIIKMSNDLSLVYCIIKIKNNKTLLLLLLRLKIVLLIWSFVILTFVVIIILCVVWSQMATFIFLVLFLSWSFLMFFFSCM